MECGGAESDLLELEALDRHCTSLQHSPGMLPPPLAACHRLAEPLLKHGVPDPHSTGIQCPGLIHNDSPWCQIPWGTSVVVALEMPKRDQMKVGLDEGSTVPHG